MDNCFGDEPVFGFTISCVIAQLPSAKQRVILVFPNAVFHECIIVYRKLAEVSGTTEQRHSCNIAECILTISLINILLPA